MKVYVAEPGETTATVLRVNRGRRVISRPLPKHDPRNHSPTGFAWGYAGSGPAAFAASLAYDLTGCTCGYQHLKERVIAQEPQFKRFVVPEGIIRRVLDDWRAENGHTSDCEKREA